jgi:type IV secretion system protein TrbI
MSATSSPALLVPKPKRRKGVRRLNYWPIYLGTGALGAVILVGGYTYKQRMDRQTQVTAAADASQAHGADPNAKELFGPGRPATTTTALRDPTGSTIQPSAPVQAAIDLPEEERRKAWAAYYAGLAQLAQERDAAQGKAMTSDSGIETPSGVVAGGGSQAIGSYPGNGAAGGAGGDRGPAIAGTDANAQAEKRSFLSQSGDPLGLNEDLAASLHGMKTDAIMQGTAIPGLMVGGLTSDMPGMVVGEVSQNVYDSATGNDLLIPQGSRVVGSYDNSVSGGQERIGVIWNRIIFPDTSSIQLGSMEGADQGGYAGFKDLVDKHWWDKFAAATIISIAGAGAQLAQPQQSAFSAYSPASVASGQLTQGYSQLGQEYARAGLAIPNTIEIRPGYVFTLMVNKDVHLPVYIDHRNAASQATKLGPIYQ